MTDFHEVEATDGVRFSWNVWPSSRLEATRMVVPLGCLYTPLKAIENLPVLPYEPVVCKGSCPSILNPFCRIDFKAKIWVCPFCYQRNHFPAHYNDINENNLPAELIPNYTTIEYALPRSPAGPPVFLWVIDTCIDEAELQALKDSLEQVASVSQCESQYVLAVRASSLLALAASLADASPDRRIEGKGGRRRAGRSERTAPELPPSRPRSLQVLQLLGSTAPTALIGLITFGTTVQVHELGYEHCVKSYTFSGQKDIEPPKLAELLGIGQPQRGARGAAAQPDARAAQGRFLLPVAEAEFAISSVIAAGFDPESLLGSPAGVTYWGHLLLTVPRRAVVRCSASSKRIHGPSILRTARSAALASPCRSPRRSSRRPSQIRAAASSSSPRGRAPSAPARWWPRS